MLIQGPAVRAVLISDLHGLHRDLAIPAGEILIVAGDLTRAGHGLADVDDWLGSLPHPVKLVVAGNNDFELERHGRSALRHAEYLQDRLIEVAGLRIYGTPWTPRSNRCAFTLDERSAEMRRRRRAIPSGLDILITHAPPWGVLDCNGDGTHRGCAFLRERLREAPPRVHVFGHIHEGHGTCSDGATAFYNASVCSSSYAPVNRPHVIDI